MTARLKSLMAITLALLALAVPAAAQSTSEDTALVGVQIGLLRFNEFASSKVGLDVNYGTKSLTKPAGSVGLRTGVAAEVGFHKFDGTTLKLFQGGVQLKMDKLDRPRFKPYARIMFGLGNVDGGTDTIMSLLPGADITMPGKPYNIRVEVGQVWDFYDGGHQVAWRYSVGVSLPVGK